MASVTIVDHMYPRIKKIRTKMRELKCPAYLITDSTNIRYLVNYPAKDAWLLVTPRNVYYLTDGRYTLAVRQALLGVVIKQFQSSLFDEVLQILSSLGITSLGFDNRYVSLYHYEN
ncbi:MAG: aminopeptidase P family N-terminal domain-containing protein, partial [Candidatus Omnitrophica bacterium]|nr:aminopeptidase P family N-terminal domain-containing protein [Candidatus Omnitrophota bacterium]